jgi:hypothetical protein
VLDARGVIRNKAVTDFALRELAVYKSILPKPEKLYSEFLCSFVASEINTQKVSENLVRLEKCLARSKKKKKELGSIAKFNYNS